jgi:hypothetical protein
MSKEKVGTKEVKEYWNIEVTATAYSFGSKGL